MRSKAEALALAARHVAAGKKIVMAFDRVLPMGYVLKCWAASESLLPQPEEVIDDQPLIVVREASYDEYLDNRPAEFSPRIRLAQLPPQVHFYEMTCE